MGGCTCHGAELRVGSLILLKQNLWFLLCLVLQASGLRSFQAVLLSLPLYLTEGILGLQMSTTTSGILCGTRDWTQVLRLALLTLLATWLSHWLFSFPSSPPSLFPSFVFWGRVCLSRPCWLQVSSSPVCLWLQSNAITAINLHTWLTCCFSNLSFS